MNVADHPVADSAASTPSVDEAELRRAVEELNVMMKTHAGRVVLDDVAADGVVQVHFEAFCSGCPFRPATFAATIRPRLMQVPGVSRVEAPGTRMSAAAEARFVELGFGLQPPRTRHVEPEEPTSGRRQPR